MIKAIPVVLVLLIFISCGEKKEMSLNKSFEDSLWISFRDQLENRNTEYLLANSLDTIQCTECKIEQLRPNEFYESGIIYSKHIDELMHLKSLKEFNFSTFTTTVDNNQLVRVSYSLESSSGSERYNLIFSFLKTERGYLFQGMILT